MGRATQEGQTRWGGTDRCSRHIRADDEGEDHGHGARDRTAHEDEPDVASGIAEPGENPESDIGGRRGVPITQSTEERVEIRGIHGRRVDKSNLFEAAHLPSRKRNEAEKIPGPFAP